LLGAGHTAPNWVIWPAILPIGIGGGVTVPAMTSALLETIDLARGGGAGVVRSRGRRTTSILLVPDNVRLPN
jgi:DHA2 family methylenomycin A resistance protein-like MFS transporter